MAPQAAAIYARISSDPDGTRMAITRQIEDCRAFAQRRRWQIADVYVDDDVSAYSARRRPEYGRMLGDLQAGRVDGVIVYHLDRLHRRPRELEDFLDVCTRAGVRDMACVTGEIDLATHDGQFHARILGAVSRKESDDKSRRISRKHLEIARAGRVSGGGARPYGYAEDRVTIVREEAAVIGTWRSGSSPATASARLPPTSTSAASRRCPGASGGHMSSARSSSPDASAGSASTTVRSWGKQSGRGSSGHGRRCGCVPCSATLRAGPSGCRVATS